MQGTEKQVTKVQLFCMIIIVGLASTVLILPSVLAAESGRDLWLSMLLSFAVYFVLFFLVVQIYKLNPDAGLYEILKESLGAVGAKIIYALFALFFAYKSLMLFCETEEFCLNRLYASMPWYVYALVIGALLVFMAARGLRSIARTGQLSLIFVFAALLICTGSAVGQMDIRRLFPVMENGFAPVFKGFYKTAAWFGDFLMIFMILGKIKPDKKLPRTLYGAYGITALSAVAFMAAYYSLYGSLSGFQGHGEAFANIINFSKDSSMGLISSIFNQFWLIACLIKLTVLFWAANEAVMKICGCEKPLYSAAALAAALYILNIFVFDNIDITLYFAVKYVNYFAAAAYTVLPAVILICAVLYKKRRGGKGGGGAGRIKRGGRAEKRGERKGADTFERG